MTDLATQQQRCRELLGDAHADSYPHALEREFPRIFDKIFSAWGTPQLDSYFDQLLVTDRPGRQGFPDAIAQEIMQLYRLYHQLGLARPDAPSPATGWDWIADIDFTPRDRKVS